MTGIADRLANPLYMVQLHPLPFLDQLRRILETIAKTPIEATAITVGWYNMIGLGEAWYASDVKDTRRWRILEMRE